MEFYFLKLYVLINGNLFYVKEINMWIASVRGMN